jgi:hypothetical protein
MRPIAHAVDNFIRHVLPRVVREIPRFDLKLAGAICAHAPDSPNVTKLGWVRDVNEAFAQAPLSLNPVLVGTGINIKLLEAMFCGCAVRVDPPQACGGLPEITPTRRGRRAGLRSRGICCGHRPALRGMPNCVTHLARAALDDARRMETPRADDAIAHLPGTCAAPEGPSPEDQARNRLIEPTWGT